MPDNLDHSDHWGIHNRCFRETAEYILSERICPVISLRELSDIVQEAFLEVGMPKPYSKAERDERKDAQQKCDVAAKHLRKSIDAIDALHDESQIMLFLGGSLNVDDLRDLLEALERQSEMHKRFLHFTNRNSEAISAADIVAEGVARVFDRLSIPVTTGQTEGRPSTAYGRAVKAAIEVFEIFIKDQPDRVLYNAIEKKYEMHFGERTRPHWRRPAERARAARQQR